MTMIVIGSGSMAHQNPESYDHIQHGITKLWHYTVCSS